VIWEAAYPESWVKTSPSWRGGRNLVRLTEVRLSSFQRYAPGKLRVSIAQKKSHKKGEKEEEKEKVGPQ